LISEISGGETFCGAEAAIILFFDLDHLRTKFVAAHHQDSILTGIDCAGDRDVAFPFVEFPKDCPRERLNPDDVAQFILWIHALERIR
jgi:hypothetical protein